MSKESLKVAGFSNAIRLTTVFLTPRQGGSPNNNIPTTPTTQPLPGITRVHEGRNRSLAGLSEE
jgi:hypothetical protein